jgi:SNF2 family DNA or RNA helicase
MSCTIATSDGCLTVDDPLGRLTGRHYSQLCYWGFRYEAQTRLFIGSIAGVQETLDKLLGYLSRHQIPFSLSKDVKSILAEAQLAKNELSQAIETGAHLKAGNARAVEAPDFLTYVATRVSRPLKEHQIKAALHLIGVRNGANFSVPGSGKTAVVLSVFHWLRSRGEVDSLFVVGPPSCFVPWRTEYELVIGKEPSCEILAGGNVEERRSKYYAGKNDLFDLYLTTYQTLQRDWDRVKLLFNQRGVRFFFVVDEGHYIKQIDGVWANAVLNVGQYATIRCVLTGTPFPQSYADAFNLFDLLWPGCSPITRSDKIRIESYVQKKKDAEAADVLDARIGPLFYRVRKSDLGLAPQEFCPPVVISMNKYERLVYDAILDKIQNLSKEDYFRDIDLLLRLRRGRIIRLRQCLSYARLLGSAVLDYGENLLEGKMSLAETIKRYDELESPAKLETLLGLVGQLRQQGEKVVIWSNFVETLKLICARLKALGHGADLIYGETPTETSSVQEELTREKIIASFVRRSSGLDVLVANPAACAESISLHKECSHAIYYDLSYNCAQYLQSLDRIHRVGGSENKIAHYHFLRYADTIDKDILTNVQKKSQNMSAVIDQDYPIYSLDMFSTDEELEAYERLFGHTIGHSRKT